MEKFYYFLAENPNYPEMMIASSKAEVKSLILENIGRENESSILNILSEKEFAGKNNNEPEFQDPGDFNSGNDFFNSIIKGANKKLSDEAGNTEVYATLGEANSIVETPVKYFEAGGEQFKMENGKIYKKVWREVSDKESFRIISSSSSKPIKSDKYKIENLIWEEI